MTWADVTSETRSNEIAIACSTAQRFVDWKV